MTRAPARISHEMSRAFRKTTLYDAWRSTTDGTLHIRLSDDLTPADLGGLWEDSRGVAYEVPLLHLLVAHPRASEALLLKVIGDGPPRDVLLAIATAGRVTARVLDEIEPGGDAGLQRAVALARFVLLLDHGATAESIRDALADFGEEPGLPAHYLAACHVATPSSILEALTDSDEDHVARAAEAALSRRGPRG